LVTGYKYEIQLIFINLLHKQILMHRIFSILFFVLTFKTISFSQDFHTEFKIDCDTLVYVLEEYSDSLAYYEIFMSNKAGKIIAHQAT